MPPKDSYADRVYTTSVVGYPECSTSGEDKDFSPLIEQAIALGGYAEDQRFTGINGGDNCHDRLCQKRRSFRGRSGDGRRQSPAPSGISSSSAAATARARAGIITPSL